MDKKETRLRRAKRTRAQIQRLEVPRLCVFKTPRHIYAQLISDCGQKVLAAASTVEKDLKGKLKYTGNVLAATAVGKLVAERALSAGVTSIAFDRSGFKYHGRIKALADAARASGLQF